MPELIEFIASTLSSLCQIAIILIVNYLGVAVGYAINSSLAGVLTEERQRNAGELTLISELHQYFEGAIWYNNAELLHG